MEELIIFVNKEIRNFWSNNQFFVQKTEKRLPGQRSTSRIHQINIVQNALEALKQARPDINMVGINPSDIVDGKTSVVLGLIWRMVLNFQVQLISFQSIL